MANSEHLSILQSGVGKWNEWRKAHARIVPDLTEANLSGANLTRANLEGANLTRANLFRAELHRANLEGAALNEANLTRAYLTRANLSGASLDGAILDEANLFRANLNGANLLKTSFLNASMDWTVIGDVDTSECLNLETVRHFGPSVVGIGTISLSKGKIPHPFLRGAGVPDNLIKYIASLTGAAFDYYSCFISYSSKDEEFTKRLYGDLGTGGVGCWLAPEDLKIGQKFRAEIDKAIRKYDKLLLILSDSSVKSDWVEKEVETAFEKERKEGKSVLFPVRLDDSVFETGVAWAADIRRTRQIGDFRTWQDNSGYKAAFERLLRDLKSEEGKNEA